MSDSSELMLLIQAERMLAKATGKHMRLPPRNRLALSAHTIQPARTFKVAAGPSVFKAAEDNSIPGGASDFERTPCPTSYARLAVARCETYPRSLTPAALQPAQAFFSQSLPRGPPSANTTSCQVPHFFERLKQGECP